MNSDRRDQAISPSNKEDQESLDLEMEDAQDKDGKEVIRKEFQAWKKSEAPFLPQPARYLKGDIGDDNTLLDLACKPCDDQEGEDQENQEDQEDEASKPKAIWKPVRPTVKEVEEHNLTPSL